MANANALDRLILAVAPKWGADRIRSRAIAETLARHYEAAQGGRRTMGWPRKFSDANGANGMALAPLRALARDLGRNNAWARNALRIIPRNVVGWGIVPKPVGLKDPKPLQAAWKTWATTTECDAAGKRTFYGIEKQVMRTVVESGECIVRRRWRQSRDGLALPVALQVLEPDYIDTNKDGKGQEGGVIIQGVEFDGIGRPTAYWLFDNHPGSSQSGGESRRHSAYDVVHVYDPERAGQVRAASWLASVIVSLRDFDEFEDAQLVRQKIAACFAGFITDVDGGGAPLGATDAATPGVETLEPGMLQRLAPGQQIQFGNPPVVTDDGFSTRTLRKIAAGLGVTYEDLTGDYSQVNFSSARMSRLAHWANVYDWQWNLLIPQFCDTAWRWAMEAAATKKLVPVGAAPGVEWTPQPMPMIEPDREARANMLMIRSGQKTLSQVLREQGMDPDAHLDEYASDIKRLDDLGIWLDSDVRRVSQAGITQARPGATGFNDAAKDAVELAEEIAEASEPAEDEEGDKGEE